MREDLYTVLPSVKKIRKPSILLFTSIPFVLSTFVQFHLHNPLSLSQWTFPHLKNHLSTSMSSTFERFHPHDPLSLSIHLSVYSFQLISPLHTIPSPPFHTCCPFLELFWFGPILLVELCLKYWTQKHLKYELKHLRFPNVECSKINYTKWKKKKSSKMHWRSGGGGRRGIRIRIRIHFPFSGPE